MRWTVSELQADLASGRTTSEKLVAEAFERIADPKLEGTKVFTRLHREAALEAARFSDQQRARGQVPSPLAGLPISIKDLLDIAGEPTPAGSIVLADAPPAKQDAPVVARLRAAGAVIVGRTNMTEFAYSGIGYNPHYGTPGSPPDRSRVPGGSSSGAAVSVADHMAVIGIGTDTGGSTRIPAAFCGTVGYKPTAKRVPLDGCVPLSFSLDSIGPLGPSVVCCAVADAVLAGEAPVAPVPLPVAGLRVAVATGLPLEQMDPAVARAFDSAVKRLADAGARVTEKPFDFFRRFIEASSAGGFAAAESFAWHRTLLAKAGNRYDPRVRVRIERGAAMPAADYVDLLAFRRAVIAEAAAETAPFDAVLLPTVPILAPKIAAMASDEEFARCNLLTLRNTAPVNFIDRCAISLPIQPSGEAGIGLMLMGEHGADKRLFAIAAGVEAALA
jgi:aspartyl-tRNA(Asn)/glutamyl-tRNA(Gln) amidotransferase subunit A